jgi:hypothetical protein
MLDKPTFKYRKHLLRTAEIRLGSEIRISGMPAMLLGSAAVVWAGCVGIALVLLSTAALTAAASPRQAPPVPTEPALEPGAYPALRVERPGLHP